MSIKRKAYYALVGIATEELCRHAGDYTTPNLGTALCGLGVGWMAFHINRVGDFLRDTGYFDSHHDERDGRNCSEPKAKKRLFIILSL